MAYADGELSAAEAAQVAAHLEHCGECASLANELRSLSRGLRSWHLTSPDVPISKELSSTLDEQVARSVRSQGWRDQLRLWRIPAWAATACALLLALSVGYFSFQTRQARMLDSRSKTAAVSATEQPGPARLSGETLIMESNPLGSQQAYSRSYASDHDRSSAILLQGSSDSRVASEKLAVAAPQPMIARTAQIRLITSNFDSDRASLDDIVRRHGGYLAEMNVTATIESERKLTAALRLPSSQMESAIAELKKLGRVESESQRGEELTAQYVDLETRLGNAKNTEQRLTDLLKQRTGKLPDVLAVEQEMSRVRGEIESMEAERKAMATRVEFATVTVTLQEEHKAQLRIVPPTIGSQLRNSVIEGYKSLVESVLGLLMFLAEWGPSLVFWLALVLLPTRFLWRRFRRVAL